MNKIALFTAHFMQEVIYFPLLRVRGADSSELFLPDDLRKVDRELAAAWKLFLLTEDGLDYPATLLQAVEYLLYTSDETHRRMVANLITKRPQEVRHDLKSARGILSVSKEGRLRVIEAQNFQCACCKDDLSHIKFPAPTRGGVSLFKTS